QESQSFATLIQSELNTELQLRDRGVKQAPFRVLMGATMPAVLVELGFLSNPEEEKKLQDSAYRDQLVDALARAVGRYKALVENRPEPAQPSAGQPAPAQPSPGQPAAPAAPGAAPPPAKPPGRHLLSDIPRVGAGLDGRAGARPALEERIAAAQGGSSPQP